MTFLEDGSPKHLNPSLNNNKKKMSRKINLYE